MIKFRYTLLILFVFGIILNVIGRFVTDIELSFDSEVFILLLYLCTFYNIDETRMALSESELSDFVDWVTTHDYVKYSEGWTLRGGANGWHCTTEELLQKFRRDRR